MSQNETENEALVYAVLRDCEQRLSHITKGPIKVSFMNNELRVATSDIVYNTPEVIIAAVAKHYNLKVQELENRKRYRPLPEARIMAWHLIKLKYPHSTNAYLGSLFGLHYSSVINGLKALNTWQQNDPAIQDTCKVLKERLGM